MAKITVLGGTGYAGSAIIKEAIKHGHEVTSVSRNIPDDTISGAIYKQGSVLEAGKLAKITEGSDIIVAALAPRGDMTGKVGEVYRTVLPELAAKQGARLIIVGGFSTLRPAKDAPRFIDGNDVPEQFRAEAREIADVLIDLERSAPENLDWLFVAPAAEFGGYNPGEATGKYRVSDDIALFDENGKSDISGADFALGIVDEIDTPAHHREVISLAY